MLDQQILVWILVGAFGFWWINFHGFEASLRRVTKGIALPPRVIIYTLACIFAPVMMAYIIVTALREMYQNRMIKAK